MKNRLLILAILFAVVGLFTADSANAQGSRRAEPNDLSTGYYAVDSEDDAPQPWRPQYFFVDTTYQPFSWTRIGSGPRQFYPVNRAFWRPDKFTGPTTDWNNMDTTDNCLAGPMPIGMRLPFNFYGTDYDSITLSSNGFVGFAPRSIAHALNGTVPWYGSPTAPNLLSNPATAPAAIIAAMYADCDLRAGGDTSKVYVRTSPSGDSFFVNYYNLRISTNSGNVNNIPSGSGRERLFVTRMQIIITNVDSSIQVNYGPFTGTINGFPPIQAWRVFQNNVSLGIVNQAKTASTSILFKNTWHAVNAGCRGCNKNFRQTGQYAVKYKQWKNVVRAISVVFPTRNYEICLGQSIKPVATYQNVDNTTRTFKAKFQIRNEVTGVTVYGRVAVLNNVVPGSQRTDSSFAAYSTNPNIISQLGTFRACAVATAYDADDNWLGDRWPFDDTVCVRVYGIRTTNLPFNDPSNDYSSTNLGDIPDQRKWIAIGAQVVDGETATWDPPPPRADPSIGIGFGPSSLISPVIKLDRANIEGNAYSGSGVGDTLLSFPYNINGQTKVMLSFSYMRTGNQPFPWLWDQSILIGPEQTVLNPAGATLRPGDSLKLEFKNPNEPACNPSSSGWRRILAIDGGNDFQFKKVSTRLENTLPAVNFFNNRFRFRLRLEARFNGNAIPPPDDDGDDWFVDNISLQVPRKPEIEVMWVRVAMPYTRIPASQAVSLPVAVHLANNSTDVAIAFPIRVQIIGPDGTNKYWAIQTVTSLRGGTDTTIDMPNWNAQNAGEAGEYIIHAWLAQNGYDSYTDDNGTYTKYYLDITPPESPEPQEFAYDDNVNDFPGLTQLPGQGIGFNNNSGSFAIRFRLQQKDTVYGARVYFANGNQAANGIRLSLLKGNAGCTPGADTLGGGLLEDVRRGQLFNQWWPYYFPTPVVAAGGKNSPTQGYYWMSVSQLDLDNYMLGGDISRMGARVRVWDAIAPQLPPIYRDPLGTLHGQWQSSGDISCAFALEVTASSGSWGIMAPSSGWWPVNAQAAGSWRLFWSTNVNPAFYNQAGGYAPMIRAIVSKSSLLPVEFLYLNGKEDNGKALLTWGTASETNNSGFYVERRKAESTDDFFTKVGFVQGKGTTTSASGYAYTDRNVTPGTYEYRLIQVDLDGAEKVSNTVEVGIGAPNNYNLEQNYPNPFEPSNSSTDISFTLPQAGDTKLLVYNELGQIVRVLVNGHKATGTHRIVFDGKDNAGNELASGSYFYKLTSGTFSEMKKLTIAK